MYIAGIHLSNDHLTEGIVTSSLFAGIAAMLVSNQKALNSAAEKGGSIKSMPTTFLGKVVTPLHGVAMFLPPVIYLIAIPLNGGVQPEFIKRWNLPKGDLSEVVVNALRIAGCIAFTVAWKTLVAKSRDTLGQSFHYIGVREKHKIASSGPFAVIRHPLYTSALALELALTLMSWNYVPVAAFAICAFAFVSKIPIEEGLIESDPEIGPEYAEYKRKVRYRLIPGIW